MKWLRVTIVAFLVTVSAALAITGLTVPRHAFAEDEGASMEWQADEGSSTTYDGEEEVVTLGDDVDASALPVEIGEDESDAAVAEEADDSIESLSDGDVPADEQDEADGKQDESAEVETQGEGDTLLEAQASAPRISLGKKYTFTWKNLGVTQIGQSNKRYISRDFVISKDGYYTISESAKYFTVRTELMCLSGGPFKWTMYYFGDATSSKTNSKTAKLYFKRGTYNIIVRASHDRPQRDRWVSFRIDPYAKPCSWSGATRIPVAATAWHKVTGGGYIRVKNSSGKFVTSNSVVSISGKTVKGKKVGSTTLYLLNSAGKQVASKKVTVYNITSGKWEMQSAVNKNYVLDIQKRSKRNGARMIVWKRNNQSNQRYQFVKMGDGTYMIRCCHSGKFVDVKGGGTAKGQPVIQFTRKGNANQRWKLSVDNKNRVTFTCKKSNQNFDVKGGRIRSQAQMIQWPANNGNNQKWVLNKK